MISVRSLVVLLISITLIENCEGNEKIFDICLNGYCYWSEDISYHVHYASDCKVYFTCKHGKFLDFYRCHDSTTFNIGTRQCESHGICMNLKIAKPEYEDWYKEIAGVIDGAFEAVNKSSCISQIKSDKSTTYEKPKMILDAFTSMHQSSVNSQISSRTKTPLTECTDISSKSFPLESATILNASETMQTSTIEDNQYFVSTKPNEIIELPGSIPNSIETQSMSVNFISMLFDTQTSVVSESLYASLLPHFEDISKIAEQQSLQSFDGYSPNLGNTTNIMNDFILPLAQDIMKNEKIMSKLNSLFDVVLETADPLLYEIMDQAGSAKIISLKDLKEAWNRTSFLAGPLLTEVIQYSYKVFFKRVGDSSEIIIDYMRRNKIMRNIPSLYRTLFNLISKYRLLGHTSSLDRFKTFPVKEIQKDFKEFLDHFLDVYSDKNH